jgi:hypothetical protein
VLRRIVASLVVVCAVVVGGVDVAHAACAGAAASYGGGTGTTADPYLISTPAHLERYFSRDVDWGQSFRVAADLNMNGCTISVPYDSFTGVFDGGHHTVSNLTVDGHGFFPVLSGSAVVRNLGLNITSSFSLVLSESFGSRTGVTRSAGGLAGLVTSAVRIENSWISGTLNASVNYTQTGTSIGDLQVSVGGLVGELDGTIVDSWSSMRVTSAVVLTNTQSPFDAEAFHMVGGLVGRNLSTTVGSLADSYSTGEVSSISTSVNTNGGNANLTADAGSIAGLVDNAVTSSVAWDSTTGLGIASGDTSGSFAKSSDQLKNFATFGPAGLAWDITDGWSAATTWSICRQVNSGFPFHSGRYTTNPCVDPPGEPEPAALPWTPRILDVVVRDGSVEVTFERVHMRQTTRWYEVQSLTSGTCRALHESVGTTDTCVFDTRQTNSREQFRVIAHNAYGASDPSAWTPTAGVVVGRVAASPSPATTPARPVASCLQPASRKVTTGVRDVITIDGATCPVSISVTARRELGVTIAVPTNGPTATYTLVASRSGGASVRRVWSALNAGTLRTVIGPVKSGDWTLRLEIRSADGRVTSWTSPVVRVA